MIRTFSSSQTRSIHEMALGADTCTSILTSETKTILKKLHAEDQHIPGLEICKDTRNLYLDYKNLIPILWINK